MKGLSVSTVVVFLLALCDGYAGATSVVKDDFNDGVIDPGLWSIVESQSAIIDEVDGAVSISALAGEPSSSGELRSEIQLVGGFDVWVDYDWLAYDESGDARAILRVQNVDGSEGVVLSCHRWGDGYSRELILHHFYAGDTSNVVVGIRFPLSGRLRIRREGATFYGYYWDSADWSLIGSVDAFDTDGYAVIFDNNWSNNYPPAAFEVHWDNFHAQADYIPGAPVWGDVNKDLTADARDVQLVINEALGIETVYECDLNGDRCINALDVQLVINAALGIP